jgi:hypothetical protein
MRSLVISLFLIFSFSYLHAQELRPIIDERPLIDEPPIIDERSMLIERPIIDERPAPFERALWTTGAVLTFSTFDYIVIGFFRPDNEHIYKLVQYAFQAGISYFLYKKCGLSSTIGFNLIWWTYGADLGYYGICELRGNSDSMRWPGAGSYARDTRNGNPFIGWTPIGLLRGARAVETHPVANNTVIAQSLVGAFIGLGITIEF